MSRVVYNKLVRDRIPEIIRREGRECATATLDEGEYLNALLAKLIEEARELAQAPRGEVTEELADIYEVLSALVTAYGVEIEQVISAQDARRFERGGFRKRIKLLWTE